MVIELAGGKTLEKPLGTSKNNPIPGGFMNHDSSARSFTSPISLATFALRDRDWVHWGGRAKESGDKFVGKQVLGTWTSFSLT